MVSIAGSLVSKHRNHGFLFPGMLVSEGPDTGVTSPGILNNKPKYLVIDMENENFILDLTEEERIDIITKRVLDKYLPAFKELAK